MSVVQDWIKDHPKGVTFKCDCGAMVNLRVWLDRYHLGMSARCWKCNKIMERLETMALVELAQFDIVDHMVDNFQKEFNKKEKPIIRRIK